MRYFGVRVYDMCESIVASGFPMLKREYTPEEFDAEVENLEYWIDNGCIEFLYNQEIISKKGGLNNKNSCKNCGGDYRVQQYHDGDYYCSRCRHMLDRHGYIKDYRNFINKIDIFEDRAEIITTDINDNETARFIVDHESLPKLINIKWSLCNGYCFNHTDKILLHRLLVLDEEEINNNDIIVDHINRNKLDNRLSNLRITDKKNNSINKVSSNNTSGIIGVNYRKDRNKWRAFITIDGKQKSLGLYENIEDAIISRLKGELKYFGEFAPQIELFDKYGIEKPKITTCEKNNKYNLFKAWKHFKRAINLCGAKASSGHDCMSKGIAVHVNIKADQSFWLQFERYHFQDTVSSMSTMHCLCKFEKLNEMFSPYTDPRSIAICNEYIEIYNENPTPENFQKVIHNCPEGIELTRRVVTNYLQLKTMYTQRKNHKMFAWSKDFIKLLDELPYFYELIGINKED